jgi:hypothetical protein
MKKLMCLFALGVSLASASTVDFSYSGYQESEGYRAAGTGSLAFPDGLTSVTLPDLTAFSFSGYTNYGTYGGIWDYSYGLANLADFSLAVSGLSISEFALDAVRTPNNPPYDFFVLTPSPGEFIGNTGVAVEGPITITSFEAAAPEPASFALLGLGIVAVGGWRKLARRHTLRH